MVAQITQIPSGSDHRRSHMGPSWGTSCFLSMVLIWSSVWMDGDKPPCTQKIYTNRKALITVMDRTTLPNRVEEMYVSSVAGMRKYQ